MLAQGLNSPVKWSHKGTIGKLMGEYSDPSLNVQIVNSVAEIGRNEWDALSENRPFQSYRWYAYGEQTMANSLPVYIIVSQDGKAIGRATFWLVHEEPLPISPRYRPMLQRLLRRWPLLICRSPHSGQAGLILPEPPLREAALGMLARAARQELRRLGGSFLIFDYLEPEQKKWPGWPGGFKAVTVADPGTKLVLQWDSFDDFLGANKWRIRQHYKRSKRDAADLGIRIRRCQNVEEINPALELIRNVEQRHASARDPWARGMLENMQMINSTWLEARIGDRLIGCLLLLEDGNVQIARLPGLTDEVPHAYFMLLYEAMQEAFEKKLAALRWGSGAYETKRRLGFELEHNNEIVLGGRGLITGLIASLI
jgi:predicted N-acyltransferase